MRVDEKELRRIVNKHLMINELKRSHVQSLLLEVDIPEADAAKQAALDQALKSAMSLATADGDAINSVEFWTTIKEVVVGVLAVAGAGAFTWYAPLPIKFKLAGAAAILSAGAAGIYYVSSSADKEIEKLKQQTAVQGGFNKFLIFSNPAKEIDRKARKMIREGSLSVPYSEDEEGSSSQGYTPSPNLPTEIKTAADVTLVTSEIDAVIAGLGSQEGNKTADGNIKPDNFLGIPLNDIKESGIDKSGLSDTAMSIVDRIIDMQNQDADQNVKAIFGDLCKHPVSEWDTIDGMVGAIFLENMGKTKFLSLSEAEEANWTYGSKGSDVGLLFGDNDAPGEEHIEYLKSDLSAHTNQRTKSVIYECLVRYDFNMGFHYDTTGIDGLAKAAIDNNLPGGLINNFMAIDDTGNEILTNYIAIAGNPAGDSASNRDDKTYFGPEFLEKLSTLAKATGETNKVTVTEQFKAKIGKILAGTVDTVGVPGDLKAKLMGAIPALIGGTVGAVGGGLAGGWVGAIIGGLLGAVTGYYIYDLYDYFFGEDGILSGGSGGSGDKDGGSGTKKTKDENPVPLPARLSGLSRTAKGRVKQIEGIVNEYNKFYKITEDTIPADETWEGGGTGKTDVVWRNPFIKHVFENDTVMKAKPFAPSVKSGELWVWRDLSSELISDHPEFTPDTAGCLAFCQFVYGNISSVTKEKELDGGSGTSVKSNGDGDGEVDDRGGDNSKKPKYKKDSKYAGPDEIEIGFRLKKALQKDKKPSSKDTSFYKKVENATFLDDIDPNVSERIKIALIRSMKVKILVSGKNGHDVFTDETYNVTFSNSSGRVKKITSQDFLTGRFEKPKEKIRDVIVSYADDNLKKVLKDSELSITFKGPGKYRVPNKELNERVIRKVIRKLLIQKRY